MKKIVFLLFVLGIAGIRHASAQSGAAGQVAQRIAEKMRDTLSLTSRQKDSLYAVNVRLHEKKIALRSVYTNQDILESRTQDVENTRDSLYRIIIGNEQTYQLYKQKKRNLVR